jgi:small subunit ribosomal protein S16
VDQRVKRNGKPLEILGQYDPIAVENKAKVNIDRVNYWLQVGAKASDTVKDLLKKIETPAAPIVEEATETVAAEVSSK